MLYAPSCLPADDRPPPGSVLVTASPGPAVTGGVMTDDGWSVAFDRLVVGIGDIQLGDGCVHYSDSGYDRLLDLTGGGSQKIGRQFVLGACDLAFEVGPPSPRTLIGDGITDADKLELGARATDAYVEDRAVSVLVSGKGECAEASKRFRWAFRLRLRYSECKAIVSGAEVRGVSLSREQEQQIDVRFDAERLLRDDGSDDGARLRFGPIAAADADGDGAVTLDELASVELAGLRALGAYGTGEANPQGVSTLRDYVYLVLLPSIPRFRGIGACKAEVDSHGGEMGGP